MNIIAISIKRPIAVVAAVLAIILFGSLALKFIPIQLTPDIARPVIQITTFWPNTAPYEIEREIINQQEEVLKGLNGLEEMISTANTGIAEVTLKFNANQNMDKALLLVANRLDRVTSYPLEAEEPFLRTSGSEDTPIAWFTLKTATPKPIHTYWHIADEIIRDTIERLPGVSRVNIFGGSEIEMQVITSPHDLAKYNLTIRDIITTLQNADTAISAGDVEEGKRRYIVRTSANFETLEQVQDIVIKSTFNTETQQIERIKLSDIAKIKFAHKSPMAIIRHMGEPALAINVIRETGANVIDTMAKIKQAVDFLNTEVLPRYTCKMYQTYDETVYIDSAISLVQKNIIIGGLLAASILILFLRSLRATLIISIAIPISIIGSFVAMAAMGRSINVISLAGLSFAVGMVVDAAIIVLENIYKKTTQGLDSKKAALIATQEVWGAILVSAITTVVVFLPLLIMQVEVAQLFKDISVAISVSVLLSLLVASTVIPALAAKLFVNKQQITVDSLRKIWLIDSLAKIFTASLSKIINFIIQHKKFANLTVLTITLVAIIGTYLLLPKLEYLPEGNRNLVFGLITPPPGYNLDTTVGIAKRIEAAARPLWTPGENKTGLPNIKNFFFVAMNNLTFLGASAVEAQRVAELIPVLSRPIFQEPGTYGFINQTSLFSRDISGDRSIDLDISGPNLEAILNLARQAMFKVESILPRQQGNQYRPIPGLELGAPEIRVIPDNLKLADNNMSNRDLATTVKAFNDGFRISEITVDGRRIDLTLKGETEKITTTQQIADLPIITPRGEILSIAELASVNLTSGPTEIMHKNRVRTITVQILPAPFLPLEAAMEIITSKVIMPLQQQNTDPNIQIRLSGTADKLTTTWDSIIIQLCVALIIVYLVMAVLFESFLYPLIIMFSVPIAGAGGFLGLGILNMFTYQPLDMLTMLGFVILIGIVVNNAILIVHHTLHHINYDNLPAQQAILTATTDRIRPIFMSTLTSLFGMMPLVLFPGAGSELYRGLGSVVLGGLSLSAILTLILVPALLQNFFVASSEKD